MNVNHLRLHTHIEYEPRTYYTAFSMEFESVAAVMWEIYRSILKMVRLYVFQCFLSSSSSIKNIAIMIYGVLLIPVCSVHYTTYLLYVHKSLITKQ